MKTKFLFFAVCMIAVTISVACTAAADPSIEKQMRAFSDDARSTAAPSVLTPVETLKGVQWKMLDMVVNARAEWRVNWIVNTPKRSGVGFLHDGQQWALQFNLQPFEQIYFDGFLRQSFRDRYPTFESFVKLGETELQITDLIANLTIEKLEAATPEQRKAWSPLLFGLKLSYESFGDYRFESKSMIAHVRVKTINDNTVLAMAWLFDPAGSYRGYLVIRLEHKDEKLLRDKLPELLSRISLN